MLLGCCNKPGSNNPPCLSRDAWYTLCRTPPYPSRCLGVDFIACVTVQPFWFTAWAKLAQETAVARNLQQQGCFHLLSTCKRWAIGCNRSNYTYCIHASVYNLVCSKDAELLVLQRSHIVSHFLALFAFAACLNIGHTSVAKHTHELMDFHSFPLQTHTLPAPTNVTLIWFSLIFHHSDLQDLGNYESLMPVSLPCHPFHPLSWHLGLSSSPWRHCSCSSHRPGEGAVTPTLHMRSESKRLYSLDSKIHCTTITMSS